MGVESEREEGGGGEAQYIYNGEDLGHPYIQSTTVLCDYENFKKWNVIILYSLTDTEICVSPCRVS